MMKRRLERKCVGRSFSSWAAVAKRFSMERRRREVRACQWRTLGLQRVCFVAWRWKFAALLSRARSLLARHRLRFKVRWLWVRWRSETVGAARVVAAAVNRRKWKCLVR